VNAERRTCPACGTEFTWTPAAPRPKYCSARCKHRWHRAHGKPRNRRRRGTTRDDARPATATTAVPPPPPPPGGLAAAPACPHCRQPVALVAWLVPPAAASVATPSRHADQGT
jgi:endogenous inhibitor of DNA gyrase (YacG/DUF329 family)